MPCLLLLWPAAELRADLFRFHVETTTGDPLELTVSGRSLPKLAEQLIDTRGEFLPFRNRDLFATLRYAGVDDAIRINLNATATEATLEIPAIGFTRTFSETPQESLDDQIVDFLVEEGAGSYAAFLREINRASPVGPTDGNPRATTAFLAEGTYARHALHPSWQLSSPQARGRWGLSTRIDASSGTFSTDPADGSYYTVTPSATFRFTRRVGLSLALPAQYRRIEGSNVYDLGGEAALPIRILLPSGDRSIGWQLAPSALVAGSFSHDMAAGGILLGGGISSSLAYYLGNFTIGMGNQLTFYEGTPLSVRGYRFETDLSQQILKNGLTARYSFGPLHADGGLTYTRFLQPAAIRGYFTPSAGVGLRLTRNSGLRIGYAGDLASGWRSHSANAAVYFGW